MKIAIISDLSVGGVGSHTIHLSRVLSKLGHKVHVISYDYRKSRDVIFHRVSSFKIADYYGVPFNIKDYLGLIKKIKPDVLHFHYPGGLMDFKMKKLIDATKIPSVLTLHIAPSSKAMFVNTAVSLYFETSKFSVKSADAIICVSEFVKKGVKRALNFSENKLFVVPNGVDTTVFKPIKKKRSEKLRLLFVGRLTPEKGASHLFKIAKVLDKKIDYNLKIIGFGPTSWYYKMKSKRYKNIDFIGEVKGTKLVSNYYASCDLTLFTSVWQEPFGLVLIESMACGTPPIAYAVGATPEIIKHGHDGFLVKKVDERNFTNTIIKASKSDLSKISKNARETAVKNYSWPKIARKTVKVYENVLR